MRLLSVLTALVALGCEEGPTGAGVAASTDRGEVAADVPVRAGRDASSEWAVDAPAFFDLPVLADAPACPSDLAVEALVTVNGTVYNTIDGARVAGVTVAVEDACPLFARTTAVNGGYGLRLLRGETLFVRASGGGMVPFIRGLVVPAAGSIQDFYVLPRAVFSAAAASVRLPIDRSMGHVWVSFENATVAGYGATVGAAHDGPSLTRAADSDVAMVVSPRTLAGGAGHWFLVFPNIEVGTTTIAVTAPPGHRCTPRQSLANWIVRADAVTYYEADCD